MYKYIFLFLISIVEAKEPQLAQLKSILSNEVQYFSIKNSRFYCRSYGVITIDQLYRRATFNQNCKEKITTFYRKNPQEYYYALQVFKENQFYHLEFQNAACIIYAKGKYTYSELLLRRGLAIVEPNFKDLEFKTSFIKAQTSAKEHKRGLWKDEIIKNCLLEVYK